MKMRIFTSLLTLMLGFMYFCPASYGQTEAEDVNTNPNPPENIKVNLSVTAADGYSMARLMWTVGTTDDTDFKDLSCRLISSAVKRNNRVIASELPWSNYLDDGLPEGQISYQVVVKIQYTYTDAETNDEAYVYFDVNSDVKTITSQPRDISKVKYRIEERYNMKISGGYSSNSYVDGAVYNGVVPIYSASNTSLPRFVMTTVATQWSPSVLSGDFVRGCWHLVSKHDGKGYWYFVDNGFGSWSSYHEDPSKDTSIKIYKVLDTPEALCDPSQYKVVLNVAKTAVARTPFIYIALDEDENIFCRAAYDVSSDSDYSAAAKGYQIFYYDTYKNNPNAAPDKTGTFDVDFKNFDLTRVYDEDTDTWTGGQTQGGRCDQLSVRGNLKSGESAVLLSPGYGPYCVMVKFNNGNKVSESWARVIGDRAMGTENDAVFVSGPNNKNRVIYQARSNYYAHFEFPENETGDVTSEAHGRTIPYISASGQLNQSGSANLYFDGHAYNGVYCKDLFVASSMAFTSIGSGSFQVNLADVTGDKVTATDADYNFNTMYPIGVYAQREENGDGSANNANLSALFFQVEEESDGKHIYLYQYVPLYRIAKYEIIPIVGAVSTPIEITIDKVYENIGGVNTDIIGFDNYMTFTRPDYDSDGLGDYEIKGYDIVLRDPLGNLYHYSVGARVQDDGTISYVCEIRKMDENGNVTNEKVQMTDEKGFPMTNPDGSPKYYEDFIITEGNVGDYVENFKLPFPLTAMGDYEATIKVLVGPKTTNEIFESEPRTAIIPVNITPENPDVTTRAYRYDPSKDPDAGTSASNGKEDYPYRVDVSFDMPDGDDPVSYYEVWVKKCPNCEPEKIIISPYDCKNPMQDDDEPDNRPDTERGIWLVENGEPTTVVDRRDENCDYFNRKPTDHIPGTYDFDNDPGYPLVNSDGSPEGEDDTIFSIYFAAPEECNGDRTCEDDVISNYEIIVVPVYGAETNFPEKGEGSDNPGNIGVTGVESVEADGADEVVLYPVPADSEVTVSAPFAIESIKIYSATGTLVKVVNVDGDSNEVVVNVDSLASGFYYVGVNDTVSQKFIKR